MDLMEVRRNLLVADPELPPIYKRIAFIGVRGAQYIDTGYNKYNDTTNDYILTYKVESWEKSFGFYGANVSGNMYNRRTCMLWSNQSGKLQVSSGETTSLGSQYHGEYILNAQRTTHIYCDNENSTYQVDAEGPYSFGGESTNRNNITFGYAQANQIGNVDYYGFKIYGDSIIRRDFIPCIRIADNKPGMYDTVTKTFFINQGTGEFVVPN